MVVVQHRHPVALGRCSDQEIGKGCSAVLAPLGKCSLNIEGALPHFIRHGQLLEAVPQLPLTTQVVSGFRAENST